MVEAPTITLGPTLLYLCNGHPVGIQDYRAIMYAYKVKTRNRELAAVDTNALMGETSVNALGDRPNAGGMDTPGTGPDATQGKQTAL